MTATVAAVPKVVETPSGWLAVTDNGAYPRIGVVGATEDEARERYAASCRGWLALRERPDHTEPDD